MVPSMTPTLVFTECVGLAYGTGRVVDTGPNLRLLEGFETAASATPGVDVQSLTTHVPAPGHSRAQHSTRYTGLLSWNIYHHARHLQTCTSAGDVLSYLLPAILPPRTKEQPVAVQHTGHPRIPPSNTRPIAKHWQDQMTNIIPLYSAECEIIAACKLFDKGLSLPHAPDPYIIKHWQDQLPMCLNNLLSMHSAECKNVAACKLLGMVRLPYVSVLAPNLTDPP